MVDAADRVERSKGLEKLLTFGNWKGQGRRMKSQVVDW